MALAEPAKMDMDIRKHVNCLFSLNVYIERLHYLVDGIENGRTGLERGLNFSSFGLVESKTVVNQIDKTSKISKSKQWNTKVWVRLD